MVVVRAINVWEVNLGHNIKHIGGTDQYHYLGCTVLREKHIFKNFTPVSGSVIKKSVCHL